MGKKYLIIGGGAAGMSAAKSISGIDPDGTIIILSEEEVRPYYRPLITYILTGKKSHEDILLEGNGAFTIPGVEIVTGEKAVSVDTEKKTVRTEGGSYEYDKLLLATGSRPKIPVDIKGTDAEGVYTLRFYRDAVKMSDRIQNTTHAVLPGGGMLNLKAAFALREKDIDVTMVVNSPAVLSQLMEPEDSLLLRDAILDAGIKVITGKNVREIISGKKGVSGVVLDDGSELQCGMVCIGKGVEPATACLKESGIEPGNGIPVNEFTETDVPDIYAAGDAAVTHNPVTGKPVITGLWTNAAEMGKCAGRNIAGARSSYSGTMGILNATQLGRVSFVSMGQVHTAGTGLEVCIYSSKKSYRKLVFSEEGERLVGAVFIGDIKNAGLYRCLIKNNTPVRELRESIVGHKLHYGHFLKQEKAG